jgi:hypothetical protein
MRIKLYSDRISQVNKRRRYRNEPKRFCFLWPDVWRLNGDHHTHTLIYMGDRWSCDCEYDLDNELPCGHVMALEALLDAGILSEEKEIIPEPMRFILPAAFPTPAETIAVGAYENYVVWGKTHLDFDGDPIGVAAKVNLSPDNPVTEADLAAD